MREEGIFLCVFLHLSFFFVLQAGFEDGEKQSSSRSDFRRQSTRVSDGAGSSSRR